MCLLDTTAPGHELSQSRLLIPWSTQYHGLQSLQWPRITPDGSAIYVARENGPGSLGLVEFSARTGRPLRVVIQPQNTDGAFCGTLWSDPSGQHLTAACAWHAHTGTVDNGHFTPVCNLLPKLPEPTAAAETSSPGDAELATRRPRHRARAAFEQLVMAIRSADHLDPRALHVHRSTINTARWSGHVDRSLVTVVTCESHD